MNKTDCVIIASAGGHLREAILATKLLNPPPPIITYKAPHLKNLLKHRKIFFITHPRRNLLRLIKNIIESFLLYLKLKPKVVISTGADVTVPFCIISKILGSKIIYIETGASVYTLSLTGKIMRFFADYFFVQWEPLFERYKENKKIIYGGPLI